MTAAGTVSPARALSRHFFASFFRLSFLDDAGEESFKRALIGVLSFTIAAGLFLARLYASKYMALPRGASLAAIVAADRLFAIALPMFVTALIAALASRSIFPDDLDFRILMVMPVARRTVFAAKLAALAQFASIWIAGAVGALTLPLAIIVSGHQPGQSWAAGTGILLFAATAGCLFTIGAVAAVQGLAFVILPARMRRRGSILAQTAMIAALTLVVPFLLRASAAWRVLPDQPSWLLAIPSAWFLGMAEWLLGSRDPYYAQLASLGATAVCAACLLAAICFTAVYRRFDQSMLRADSSRIGKDRTWSTRAWLPQRPANRAVRAFVWATIRRSGLHQLVFWAIVAAGAAMACSTLLSARGLSPRWVMRAVLGTPFTVMAATLVALRIAMLLPTTLRAGWLFRLTEDRTTRAHQLDAVRHTFFLAGVAAPTLLTSPVLALQIGIRSAVQLAPIELLIGWVFVEALCVGWRRVPFTCTFLFAKRPPAYIVGLLIVIFGWFVFLGTTLLDIARAGLLPWMLIALLVGSVGLAVRWWRKQEWGAWPLEFEDYVPDGLDTLRLSD